MSNNTTATSSMSTNQSNTVADELYRIHCYANTLAKLCSTGSSAQSIDPDNLEQIFRDIADVTDRGAASLYSAVDSIKAISKFAQNNRLDIEANPDPLATPFIKSQNIMGETQRIYVPDYVNTEGLTPTEILMQGVLIPKKYDSYGVDDFELKLQSKDSFKEKYLLIPKFSEQQTNENIEEYTQRVGIKITRECHQ